MARVALAGLSVRALAERAAADGHAPLALDVFGDTDTTRSAVDWIDIGAAGAPRIDAARLLAALSGLAAGGELLGWIAASGFEDQPGLLAAGAALVPLIGTAPADVARVRDPAGFFAFLDAHDVDHPAVCFSARPTEGGGVWLRKDAAGSGGLQIRRVEADTVLTAGQYLQREVDGIPMSATFVANARSASLLGINRLLVRPAGERPHLFCGAIGPVPLAAPLRQRLQRLLELASAGFRLRGLGSLDFILDPAGRLQVLEINPRPSASLALYPDARPVEFHLRACLHGELRGLATTGSTVRGIETVYARRGCTVDAERAQWLAGQPQVHDLPRAGQRFASGDPVCSLSASGATAAAVEAELSTYRNALLAHLETSP